MGAPRSPLPSLPPPRPKPRGSDHAPRGLWKPLLAAGKRDPAPGCQRGQKWRQRRCQAPGQGGGWGGGLWPKELPLAQAPSEGATPKLSGVDEICFSLPLGGGLSGSIGLPRPVFKRLTVTHSLLGCRCSINSGNKPSPSPWLRVQNLMGYLLQAMFSIIIGQ